jgi:hypothetical protein
MAALGVGALRTHMPQMACAAAIRHGAETETELLDERASQPGILFWVTDEDPDDALRADDLVPAGGSWNGLLFDNPRLGLAPALTWTFSFRFQDVVRGDSSSEVSVDVDWVPLPAIGWQTITPAQLDSPHFAGPMEASVYFFEHYRFESVELDLPEQRGAQLHARATLRGDIDGLGLDEVSVDDWLGFDGIIVALDLVTSEQAARSQLGNFTDVSGLTKGGRTVGSGFIFSP